MDVMNEWKGDIQEVEKEKGHFKVDDALFANVFKIVSSIVLFLFARAFRSFANYLSLKKPTTLICF